MDENEILEKNINDFREMADEIKGCLEFIAGRRKEFECAGCPNIGICLQYCSLTAGMVCEWIADFMEGGTDRFVERGKQIIDSSTGKEEDKKDYGIYS